MSTPAQIDANQANARLSTGPKTEAGKAASALNHSSHGLTGGHFIFMAWEVEAQFDTLRNELRTEHQPATPTESILIDRMAQHHWLRERAQFLQGGCLN